MSTSPTKLQFAERLHEICADMKLPARGRQTQLAREFGVSQQAARKWLAGEAYPEMETVIAIADWADVNVNWLLQGSGSKRGNRVDTKALVLDEALHALPSDMGTDLIDNLRAKLERHGRLVAMEPPPRFLTMLDAYEQDLAKK